MNEDRAMVMMRLALAPAIRGDNRAQQPQARSVSLVAQTVETLQSASFDRMFHVPPAVDDDVEPLRAPSRVGAFAWQWDETSQRVSNMLKPKFEGERSTSAPISAQIMMQFGQLVSLLFDGTDVSVEDRQPFFVKGYMLEHQTADFLAEGLIRGMPVRLDDAAAVTKLTENNEIVIVWFAMDRASANFATLSYFMGKLSQPDMPRALLPWVEPCLAHGMQLIKSRARGGKELIAKAQSMCTLFRDWKSTDLLRKVVIDIVSTSLTVLHEQRPADLASSTRRCVDVLFGSLADEEYLYKKTKNGREPKPFLKDLRALINILDLKAGAPMDLVHYCFVEEGSELHLKEHLRPGGPCCQSRSQSIERVSVPLLNLLVHRAWDRQAASRWTFVSRVTRIATTRPSTHPTSRA